MQIQVDWTEVVFKLFYVLLIDVCVDAIIDVCRPFLRSAEIQHTYKVGRESFI